MASRKDFIIARPTTGNSATFARFSVTLKFALALSLFSNNFAWLLESTTRVQLQHMRSHAWRFGNPKANSPRALHRSTPMPSSCRCIFAAFDGHWELCFQLSADSSLNLICIFARGKRKLEDYDQRSSLASSSRFAFVHTSDDRKPISNAAFFYSQNFSPRSSQLPSSDIVVVAAFSPSTARD